MDSLFISYYTDDLYYKRCSDALLSSCKSLGINIEMVKISDLREYWKNTLYKPTFLLNKLKEKKSDIIWIDADTIIKKYAECFKKWEGDLLLSSHTGFLQGIKASPIGVKYNEVTIEFLEAWSKLATERINGNNIDLDHDILKYEIIPKFKDKISIEIMKDDLQYKDFSDGTVIKNGISRPYNKGQVINKVIEKNINRSKEFDNLSLKDFDMKISIERIKLFQRNTQINSMIIKPLPNSEKRTELNKWEKITGKENILVSFISDPENSIFYSSRISVLTSKIDSLGYDYKIVQYKTDRNYYQNCCYKPTYILNILENTDKNLVWIDGDTELKKSLDIFLNTNSDFDIGLVTYNNDMTGFVASPLFFRNTLNTKELLASWANHCKSMVEKGRCELDHDALKHYIFPLYRGKIRIKLNWTPENHLHKGEILDNIDSVVPYKREILSNMREINKARPFNFTNNDFIII